jgi:hypothetical protein
MRGAIPSLPHYTWRGAQLKHRDDLTFTFTLLFSLSLPPTLCNLVSPLLIEETSGCNNRIQTFASRFRNQTSGRIPYMEGETLVRLLSAFIMGMTEAGSKPTNYQCLNGPRPRAAPGIYTNNKRS